MPNYRVTLFWRLQNQGWTEQFYKVTTDGPDLVANLSLNVLVSAQRCRATGCILQAVRVQDTAANRNSFTNPINTSSGVGGGVAPDITAASARCRILFNNGGKRQIWIRGIGDAASMRTISTGATVTGGVLGTDVLGYLNDLIAFGACGRTLKGIGAGGLFAWQNVISFGPYAGNPQWTQVNLPPGAPVPNQGDVVYFRGVPKSVFPYIRNQMRLPIAGVVGVSPAMSTFVINTGWRNGATAIGVPNVQWRKVDYDYPPWTLAQFVELSTHKTGRPTTSQRGRSRGLPLRQLTLVGQ